MVLMSLSLMGLFPCLALYIIRCMTLGMSPLLYYIGANVHLFARTDIGFSPFLWGGMPIKLHIVGFFMGFIGFYRGVLAFYRPNMPNMHNMPIRPKRPY